MSYIETPQEKLTEAIRAAVLAALDAVGETHDKPYKFKGWKEDFCDRSSLHILQLR